VAPSWCRGGAVSGVECRPGCRDMPLYAAICRSLERKLSICFGLGFFFEPEDRGFESLPARQLAQRLQITDFRQRLRRHGFDKRAKRVVESLPARQQL
jgi:hypothetical protein